MESIGERLVIHYLPFTNTPLPGGVNILTVLNTLFVMFILLCLLWWSVRRFAAVPGRAQVLVELYLAGFDSLVSTTLELETREKNHFIRVDPPEWQQALDILDQAQGAAR